MADFVLIPLSDRARQMLAAAALGAGNDQAFLTRLNDHASNGVLTLSHEDVEKMLTYMLAHLCGVLEQHPPTT